MFTFDNSYARLPDRFYARVAPTNVRAPRVLAVNRALALELGVDPDALASPEGARILAGNVLPAGADPIALAYAGHQFGSFVPQLGDGRAILLGEVVGKSGRRDIQLKGSGRTPFSRRGDGLAAIGPVLREYVVSEAMAAMGIPTTRSLAAVATGEDVLRERVLPGAVLVRVAASHIRVGTFEYFAAREDTEALSRLATHALERHYPAATGTGNDALALVENVVDAQATLIAKWMGVGFVHGVMNTDNTAVSGETIDYGPCAFLDTFDPRKKFSSIDHGGRYAFVNQPKIAQWNVARLAEALLPLIAANEEEGVRLALERLNAFPAKFEAAYGRILRTKIGLPAQADEATEEADRALAADLLERMTTNHVDHTAFFRRLCASAESPAGDDATASLFEDPGAFRDWAEAWRRRTAREDVTPTARAASMRATNPAFIPRNHRVEEAIEAAVEEDDLRPFERLVAVTARPFDEQPEHAALADPPGPEQHQYRTFCGT